MSRPCGAAPPWTMGRSGATDQKRKEAKTLANGSAPDEGVGSLPASKKLKAQGQEKGRANGPAKGRASGKGDNAEAAGEGENGAEVKAAIPEAQKSSENGKSFAIRSLRKRENETPGLYREAKATRVTKRETVEVKENEAETGKSPTSLPFACLAALALIWLLLSGSSHSQSTLGSRCNSLCYRQWNAPPRPSSVAFLSNRCRGDRPCDDLAVPRWRQGPSQAAAARRMLPRRSWQLRLVGAAAKSGGALHYWRCAAGRCSPKQSPGRPLPPPPLASKVWLPPFWLSCFELLSPSPAKSASCFPLLISAVLSCLC